MGHPPRMGKFSSTHQPVDRSQPASHAEREEQRIEEAIERKEAELDDQALAGEYQPKHVELTPEEIEQEERERAQLVADLKATRPAKPGPERGAPESLSRHPIIDVGGHAPERIAEEPPAVEEPEVVPAPVLSAVEQEAALTELALLEQEVEALEAERRAAEAANAEQLRLIKQDTDTKLALIRTKREEADARAHDAREAAARIELADRARAAQHEASANRQRTQSGLEVQRAAFAETFQPVLTAAKRVLKEITALNTQSGTALRELGALRGWEDTPTTWPKELRLKMRDQVILPARELMRIIDNCFRDDDGPTYNILRAEQLLVSWRPGTPVAEVTMNVSRVNADLLRHIRDQLTEINTRFEVIEAQGKAYVSSGEQVPEVIVMLNENIRQELKQDILAKGLRRPQQTHGVLDKSDIITPTK